MLKYTLRNLARSRGFTLTAVLVLGLGIGINAAVFTVINGILFRPLPVHAPGEVRFANAAVRKTPYMGTSLRYEHFLELRERRDVFADVLLFARLFDKVRVRGNVEQAQGEMVSSNYFDLLGVKPIIGRGFDWSSEEAWNAAPVAVISYDLWQSRFNGDGAVLGETIELSAASWGIYLPWKAYTIVGVAPHGFKGVATRWDSTQYWTPLLPRSADLAEQQRLLRPNAPPEPRRAGGYPVVRLAPGVSDEHAQTVVSVFAQRVRREITPDAPEYSIELSESRRVPLPFDARGRMYEGPIAAALISITAIVLLIAAANLAGMLLARGVTRETELAVRLALGGSRARVGGLVLVESVIISAAGAAAGLCVASWLVDLLIAGTPTRFIRWRIAALAVDMPIDWRVLGFTASSALATAVVVALFPIRQAVTTNLLAALQRQAEGATPRIGHTLRRLVIVPQICLSLVLLLIAGALVRAVIRAELGNPGYDPSQVLLLDFEMPLKAPAAGDRAENIARTRRVLDRVASLPGVSAATVADTNPVTTVPLAAAQTWIVRRDSFRPDGPHFWAASAKVTGAYFATLGIPLLRGRVFDDHRDRADAAPTVIVSEGLARWMWPDRDPLGQHLARHWPDSPQAPVWMEVVGVVKDVSPPLAADDWNPAFYVPYQQSSGSSFTVAARSAGPPAELFASLKAAITSAEPTALPVNARRLEEAVDELLFPRRAAAAVLGLAGAIGLLLASTGLYGVMSYATARRVREIGVRRALGADRGDITRLILREGMKVGGTGIVLGLLLTYAAVRVASRVTPLPAIDATTLIAAPALLAAVILLACYVPALRAARVDPLEALRAL